MSKTKTQLETELEVLKKQNHDLWNEKEQYKDALNKAPTVDQVSKWLRYYIEKPEGAYSSFSDRQHIPDWFYMGLQGVVGFTENQLKELQDTLSRVQMELENKVDRSEFSGDL